jgi:SAM-dependent methyltransferase
MRVVEAAYDELGSRSGEWMVKIDGEPLDRFLGRLVASLDEGVRVLELGCGDGTTTERLTERFGFVGVDISSERFRLPHAAVPHRWFKAGGVFIAPMSTVGGPDRVESWLGVQMCFSGWDAETNESLVRAAGLEVLVAEIIGACEPKSEYETAFLWVPARKPE